MAQEKKLRRVAITGIGGICGLGHSVDEIWRNSLEGRSGVSLLSSLNTENMAVKIGGEVKNFKINNNLLSEKEQDHYDRFVHFALHSAHEAMQDAKLAGEGNSNPYAPEMMGSILGVGLGGFPMIEKNFEEFLAKGPRRVSPFFIPACIPNMTTGMITIHFGMRGTNYTATSACASSGHAISAAATEIMLGNQQLMITGGAESVMCALPLNGFSNMKALSRRNEEPEKASRPFDKDRSGFVMGEGAGILVLEDYEMARARGARIYAELAGFGSSSDAHHITAPHPEGEGAILCMKKALASAGIAPEQIDYINAHGTSTPLGDIAETKAIRKTFGSHADKLAVSSTKSMTGHLLGAAGGIESVFTIKAIYEGILPPTINLDNQDPECDLNYVPNKPQVKNVEYALNNSFGFGGTNSCLVFKKVHE